MKKSKRIIAFFAVVFAMLGSPVFAQKTVATQKPKPAHSSMPALTNQQKQAANSSQCKSTDFALKLFAGETSGSGKNAVVSPFSAYAALSMAMNGAAGNTLLQMARALGVTADQIGQLNQRNQSVLAKLAGSKSIQLEIGNAVYSDTSTPFKSSFIDSCKAWYHAEAHNIDFGPAAVATINAWCNQKTHGKIPAIISKLEKDDKMVIINAVYFKGKWADRFEEDFTKDDQFNTLSGAKSPVKMMHKDADFRYMKGSDFQAVSIPYDGKKQSLLVFLPDKGVDFGRFRTEFTRDRWNQWMTLFQKMEVNLSLPRFKVEYQADLAKTLKAMGMPEAFSSKGANFSNMIALPKTASISSVLQRTYMDVNEEGTEAAAATAVTVAVAACVAPPKQVLEFRVDRPFVVALIDEDSGEILFLGSIVKP